MPGAALRQEPAGRDALSRWLPVLVLIPVAASAVSALVQRWVVVSDGAVIMVLARDVTHGDGRLVGIATSIAEVTHGPIVYHPGPLLFWVLAPFAWLFGPTVGAIVGVSLIHGTALAGCVLVARRAGDRAITLGVAVTALVVAFTVLGPGHYYDPFNTPLPAIWLLLVYLCAWRLLCGDHGVLPVAAFAASFCAQVHVSYLVAVLVALVPAVAVWAVRLRREAPSEAEASAEAPGAGRRVRRSVVLTAVVLLVCWSGPLIQAAAHRGGNLRELASGASGDSGILGIRGAWWTLTSVVALPPLQVRNVDDASFRAGPSIVGVLVAIAVVVLVVRVLRRSVPAGRALLATAGLALLGGALTSALLPDEPIEAPQMTWFKVLVPFGVLAIWGAWALARTPDRPRRTWPGLALFAVVLVVASYPFPIRNGFDADSWLFDAAPEVSREVRRSVDPDGTYRLRARGGVRFELLQHTLIADLDGRGWDIGVTDRNRTYYGDQRVVAAGPGVTDLIVQDASLAPPTPDAERVATYRAEVDPAEQAAVQREIQAWAAAHPPLALTSEGTNNLADALLGRDGIDQEEVDAIRTDPERLLDLPPDVLAEVYRNSWVAHPELPGGLAADLRRVLGPSSVDVWAVPSTDDGT